MFTGRPCDICDGDESDARCDHCFRTIEADKKWCHIWESWSDGDGFHTEHACTACMARITLRDLEKSRSMFLNLAEDARCVGDTRSAETNAAYAEQDAGMIGVLRTLPDSEEELSAILVRVYIDLARQHEALGLDIQFKQS